MHVLNLSLLLSRSEVLSQAARGRKAMVGDAWAGFWVIRDAGSGGAGLDICRYLQLSHQVFNTPQSPSGGRIVKSSENQ